MAHTCANIFSQVLEAALARWRVFTHFLLAPDRSQTCTEYVVNSDIIKGAAEKLSADVRLYLVLKSVSSEEERKESLEKTLRLEAKFGLRLFSQGAKWGFKNWDKNEKIGGVSGGAHYSSATCVVENDKREWPPYFRSNNCS